MAIPDPAEVVELFTKNYISGSAVLVTPITSGEENQNYYIDSDGKKYVLRLYSTHHSTTGLRTQPEIDFELDFISHLRRHNVPTPQVIPTQMGAQLAEVVIHDQTRYTVLFEYAKGKEPSAYSHEIARSLAKAMLQIRAASTSFRYTQVRRWPGNIVEQSLNYYAENRQGVGKYQADLDAMYANARDDFQRINKQTLPIGIIHGDIKLGNVLFDRGQIKAILDFDDYRESYLLEELTRTLMHDLDSPTRNAIRSGCYHEFLAEFEHHPAVTPAELAHLGTFMRARFIYDITVYLSSGLNLLVEEVFADKNITEVLRG